MNYFTTFQIHHEVNFGCGDICKNYSITLGHISAKGPSDTLHYVWDFTRNPSILLAVTSPTANLSINWDKYMFNLIEAVRFTEEPKYTMGIAVKRVRLIIFFLLNKIN